MKASLLLIICLLSSEAFSQGEISEVKYEANKAGFGKAFPKYTQQIEIYLQQMARQRTPIKFYKEADLIALLNFCTSLL